MSKRGPKGKAAPPSPTPYSRALAEAIDAAGMSHEAIAAAVGVSPALISAWATARKPVSAKRAGAVGALLDVAPESISADYAIIAEGANVLSMPGAPALDPDLERSRVENDIDALRRVVSALVNAMTIHRPAEAGDVARTLRASAPKRFLEQGYLGGQLAILESAVGRTKAAAPATSRRRAKP